MPALGGFNAGFQLRRGLVRETIARADGVFAEFQHDVTYIIV
jgi:hypothetical protein